jgi:hypothetical protein
MDPATLPSWFPSMRELEEALERHYARGYNMDLRVTAPPPPPPPPVTDPDSVIVEIGQHE